MAVRAFWLALLTRLRIKGIGLSIDDFGTGYSTVQQLRNVPATELKIDKTLVQKMLGSDSDRIMVLKTIEIGHALDMGVVAEGVETVDQLQFLLLHGCDVAQGYLFTRPVTVLRLSEWMTSNGLMKSDTKQRVMEARKFDEFEQNITAVDEQLNNLGYTSISEAQ
jgi:EAL domain-containing protein (putative c-di-GMP-specific phosphodiesterase class I)